jgi:hypothetical protein
MLRHGPRRRITSVLNRPLLLDAVRPTGERVVVRVTDTTDGGLDTGIEQALCVPNRNILAAPVAVVDEATFHRTAVVQRLLQGIEDEIGMCRPRHPPADDAAGEDVDDEGHVHEALPSRHVGEIRHPQGIRMRRPELPVHLVRRARGGLVSDRGPGLLAADCATQAHPPHQALHRTAGHRDALPAELPPDLAGAVDPEVGRVHSPDLLHEHLVLPSPGRGPGRIGTLRNMGVVGRRSDPQHSADRLDPVDRAVIVDEDDHGFERRSSSAIAK